MNISDAVITAQAMVAKFGAEWVSSMDQRALDHEAEGDTEAAIFWRRVALAARLLTPRSSCITAR